MNRDAKGSALFLAATQQRQCAQAGPSLFNETGFGHRDRILLRDRQQSSIRECSRSGALSGSKVRRSGASGDWAARRVLNS